MQAQEAENYFASRTEEEECPIVIDQETSIKYYRLEQLFNSFFPNDSLSIAKEKSKEERDFYLWRNSKYYIIIYIFVYY